MQGMNFLQCDVAGRPVNNGVIGLQVTENHYLCHFMKSPRMQRLCHVDEISKWFLFGDSAEMNKFIISTTDNSIKEQQNDE